VIQGNVNEPLRNGKKKSESQPVTPSVVGKTRGSSSSTLATNPVAKETILQMEIQNLENESSFQFICSHCQRKVRYFYILFDSIINKKMIFRFISMMFIIGPITLYRLLISDHQLHHYH
jgi:hypothetical protein